MTRREESHSVEVLQRHSDWLFCMDGTNSRPERFPSCIFKVLWQLRSLCGWQWNANKRLIKQELIATTERRLWSQMTAANVCTPLNGFIVRVLLPFAGADCVLLPRTEFVKAPSTSIGRAGFKRAGDQLTMRSVLLKKGNTICKTIPSKDER